MRLSKKALIVPMLGAIIFSVLSSVATVSGSSVFTSTFEIPNNNFAQFDGTSGSACTVQNSVVYSGYYSARLAIKGDSQFFFKSIPSTSTISVRFSFFVEDIQLVQNDPIVFLKVYDSTSKAFWVEIDVEEAAPHWKVVDGLTGSGYSNTTATVTLNSWNDILFTVAKSGNANSEIVQLYVNGELTCRLTGTGNGNGIAQLWFMGEQVSNAVNLYFDAINVDNEIINPPFPTPTPTYVPTPSPSPTLAPTPLPSPTPTPTPSPTPTPTSTPLTTPTPTPFPTPISTPTSSLSPTPTQTVVPTPSPSPIVSPTPTPSSSPISTQKPSPSGTPTLTSAPTLAPTIVPPAPSTSSSPTFTPKSTSTPPVQDSETTNSTQGFSYTIPVLLIIALVSLTTFTYFLTKRRKNIKNQKFDPPQLGETLGKIRTESSGSDEFQNYFESLHAETQSSSPNDHRKSKEQVVAFEPQRPELKHVDLAVESQQSIPKSNECPKNLEYFLLKPRPKQMPEECLTCQRLLTCVCLTEK